MKKISAVLCLAFLCFGLAGAAMAEPMKIGILPVLDTLPLQVADRDGLFKEHGLDVELVPFASAMERDTAMLSGNLDGYFGDLIATLLLIENNVPMRIATVSFATDTEQRMFALVKSGECKKSGDEPLTVGLSFTTIMEYLLDTMVPLSGAKDIPLGRMEVKKMPIRLQMLLEGQIDSAMLPEPLATLAESKGGTILATDSALPEGTPLTVICLHQDKAAQVEAFLAAYAQAVKNINEHPEDYREFMAKSCRIPAPLAPTFPIYRYPEPVLPSEADITPVQEWMIAKNMLKKALAYDTCVFQ